jgi:hypothetical protein
MIDRDVETALINFTEYPDTVNTFTVLDSIFIPSNADDTYYEAMIMYCGDGTTVKERGTLAEVIVPYNHQETYSNVANALQKCFKITTA